MVEFFVLSVIRSINSRLPIDVETFLKPDVDAQNAIAFEWERGRWLALAFVIVY